ncbi:MAG: hypothetical protein E6H02_08045 [Bacillati bacterium ANGP1]|uniref:GIY-YIG domain-containing protein n=1 Tax=Candidatus Segetimicrobium genomatis TaxID=2569760 RepID=A0A537LR18_9BACT|nr:MAG: hypothetical protein E6H02_08045 [Terrabacteria group bacterium ANGP1]
MMPHTTQDDQSLPAAAPEAAVPADLSEKLGTLPDQPGVYLMKDRAGRVLYVGKAASLRARVRQYFQPGHTDSPRILHLISKIRDVETVVVANEVEALILEATLIKRHHPWYNVRLADDKAYPYLKLTSDPFPKIVMTRKVVRDGAKYFGPYPYHEPKLVGRSSSSAPATWRSPGICRGRASTTTSASAARRASPGARVRTSTPSRSGRPPRSWRASRTIWSTSSRMRCRPRPPR